MHSMFYQASDFTGKGLAKWQVSSVREMWGMFADTQFNSDVSNWDVSKVTVFDWMFARCTKFESDLSSWVTSSATNMWGMFNFASSFNSNLSSWDVSEVCCMGPMFEGASSFNGDVSSWDVSGITLRLEKMFKGATKFNQNLCAWGDLLANIKDDPEAADMFLDTSCEVETSPDFSAVPRGPFCFPCLQ